jgi:predicted AlkP superfamily pyrophosphatase or phosphodiesterase
MLALLALASLSSLDTVKVPATAARPRLVVVVSIDQFRGDYVSRFADAYLQAKQGSRVGGFRFLSELGANYLDCHYDHVPTETGPGHSVIMTGSTPALTGIAGNAWYDRANPDKSKRRVYCVTDPQSQTVGGKSGPMSPRNLRVSTIGDELKMATNGKAKVVGIAIKDRAAILMAGHAADTVVWYEDDAKGWVTSTFYAPDKRLPSWVAALNAEKLPERLEAQNWTPLKPDSVYWAARPAPFVKGGPTKPVFSHPVKGRFASSAQGQEFVLLTVKRALHAEGLGRDDVPDVLVVNLSTNDYVGHEFGPNSPEVMDISIRTDRLLSDLFNTLNKEVPGGLSSVVIAVTADHGVVAIPEESRDLYRMSGIRRGMAGGVAAKVDDALTKAYGDGDWVAAFEEPNLYIDRELLASRNGRLRDAQELAADAAASAPGVYAAFSADAMLRGSLPSWPWVRKAVNGFHPLRSGDVLVFSDPGSYWGGGTGTGHGSPWPYDTHVPMLLHGPGIRPGRFAEQVSVSDLAPTLSVLLRIGRLRSALGGN